MFKLNEIQFHPGASGINLVNLSLALNTCGFDIVPTWALVTNAKLGVTSA